MFIWSYVSKSVIIRLFYVSKSVKIMKRKIAGRRIAINPLYAISNLYK